MSDPTSVTDPTDPTDTITSDGCEGTAGCTDPTDADSSVGPPDPTTSGPTSSTGDTDPTGGPAVTCEDRAQCVVVDDCCTCDAIPADAEPPACDLECIQSACSALGIDPIAQCELDHCELAPQSCDPFDATCDELPPPCPEGQLATIDPVAGCWTGMCVAAAYCDVVPSCELCPADETCVGFISQLPYYTCVPIPDACGGTPSCECLGELCVAPYDACSELEGEVSCNCPNC